MPLSPAQQNQQRKRAAKAAASVGPALTMEGATAYEMQLAQLHQHRQQLHQVQSQEAKAELKLRLLPDYAPYIDGVLGAGKGAQDEVLTTLMLWHFDAGEYSVGLRIGEYVLQHGLTMPDRFNRSAACLIAEEPAELALRAMKAGNSFPVGDLLEAQRITAEQDMPDQARAKLHLAIGRAYAFGIDKDQLTDENVELLENAREHLTRAIELDDNCGGKKDLEGVNRLLKKHASTTG
ncbi:phage terminase small subunit [Pseudomonas sp. NyZ704]|nr:phage terminase small subunit [Pseudomonas sp. NyZ704]